VPASVVGRTRPPRERQRTAYVLITSTRGLKLRTVTHYYGITSPVPFLDVDVDVDSYMFVDPFKIRMGLGPTSVAAAANVCTSSFFDQITSAVVSSNPAHRRRGLDLLQHFEEPYETRLGMSKLGFHGHGGADGVGQIIWDALDGNAAFLVRVGVLHQIEDIPMFVEGIANDITSDLTTRVIFEPLVDFTNDCVSKFPQLAGGTGLKQVTRQVWDPMSSTWVSKKVTLPTVDGKPLLLIPEEWTTHNLLLNAGRLYDTELLTHVQTERAVIDGLVDAKGRLVRTPKYRLKQDARLHRSNKTIIKTVEDAYGKGTDIVKNFKRWAEERYRDSLSG